MERRRRHHYLCPDAHVSGVIVELLSAFQTCDVGTGRWAIGFMDRRDWPGDEPVMATKQQFKHFADHMLPCRDRNPAHTPSRSNCRTRSYVRSILQKVNWQLRARSGNLRNRLAELGRGRSRRRVSSTWLVQCAIVGEQVSEEVTPCVRAVHVANRAAGFGDQQCAGRHVPRLQAELPEDVEPPAGDIGQIDGRGARCGARRAMPWPSGDRSGC